MTSRTAGFLFILGMLLTFGGVGGIETSETSQDMLGACVVSIVGLLTMWASSLALRVSSYYDHY